MDKKKAVRRHRFIKDKHLEGYVTPNMVEKAKEMLEKEDISEEGFLGAQAVLLLNGLL